MKTIRTIKVGLTLIIIGLMLAPTMINAGSMTASKAGIFVAFISLLLQVFEVILEDAPVYEEGEDEGMYSI